MSRENSKDEAMGAHFEISDNHSSDFTNAEVLSPSSDPADSSGEDDDGINEQGREDLDHGLPKVQKSSLSEMTFGEVKQGILLLQTRKLKLEQERKCLEGEENELQKKNGEDLISVQQELGLYLRRRDEYLTLIKDAIIKAAAKEFINAVGQEGYDAAAHVFRDAKEGNMSIDEFSKQILEIEIEKTGIDPNGTPLYRTARRTFPNCKKEGTEETQGGKLGEGEDDDGGDLRQQASEQQQQPAPPPPVEEVGEKAVAGPPFKNSDAGPVPKRAKNWSTMMLKKRGLVVRRNKYLVSKQGMTQKSSKSNKE